jgi:hypothetical protein
MGQPRKLRGDRRRHASPVKLFTQAKTTGSLIQRLSRRGTATTNAEPARTNVAKSTNLQHQEHGRRVYVDPGASWRALTRQFRSSATKSCPPFPTAGARWRWLQRRHPRRAVADPWNTARMSAPGRDSHASCRQAGAFELSVERPRGSRASQTPIRRTSRAAAGPAATAIPRGQPCVAGRRSAGTASARRSICRSTRTSPAADTN